MTDNVPQFPKQEAPEWLTGPWEPEYRVELHGHAIPLLTGKRRDGGAVTLFLDRRFGADFSSDADAFQAAVLIAHALAIGQGYSHYGATTKDIPFAPKSVQLGEAP